MGTGDLFDVISHYRYVNILSCFFVHRVEQFAASYEYRHVHHSLYPRFHLENVLALGALNLDRKLIVAPH